MEMTAKQRLVSYQRQQDLSRTIRELLTLIEDAEKMAANADGLEKYGHDLYRMKNNLLLELEAVAERAAWIANQGLPT
jgi:spore maturation protein CgeB